MVGERTKLKNGGRHKCSGRNLKKKKIGKNRMAKITRKCMEFQDNEI